MHLMRTIWDSSHYRQQRLSDLDFADIIALIDDPEVKLQNGPSQLEQKGGKVGLTANAKKTKVNYANIQGANSINHKYRE